MGDLDEVKKTLQPRSWKDINLCQSVDPYSRLQGYCSHGVLMGVSHEVNQMIKI